MKIVTSLILLLLTYYQTLLGQATIMDLPNVITPSETPSSMTAQVDQPIKMSSGKLHNDIPLFSVGSDVIKQTVSLSYNSSGITVASDAGVVGLNWNLNAGGLVSRMVVGLPDDFTDGFRMGYFVAMSYLGLYSDATINQNMNGLVSSIDYCDRLKASNGDIDMEPDIYYLNFDGKSARMFFQVLNDGNGPYTKAVFIPAMPWVINERDAINGFPNGIIIVTEDGKKYSFGIDNITGLPSIFELARFVAERDGNSRPQTQYKSAWFLTKIQNAFNDQEIECIYEPIITGKPSYLLNERLVTPFPTIQQSVVIGSAPQTAIEGIPSPNPSNGFSTTNYDTYRLKEIKAKDEKLVFEYNAPGTREDLPIGVREGCLDKVVIYSSNGGVSVAESYWKFYYDYFNSDAPNGTPANETYIYKRLKLDAVRKFAMSSNNIGEQYEFEYYYDSDHKLPGKNSFAIDHWGYYNGENQNTTLIPQLEYANEIFSGANRNVNPQMCDYYLLKRVILPTGGSKTFEYEQNTFSRINGNINHNIDYTISSVNLFVNHNESPIINRDVTIDNMFDQYIDLRYDIGKNGSVAAQEANIVLSVFLEENGSSELLWSVEWTPQECIGCTTRVFLPVGSIRINVHKGQAFDDSGFGRIAFDYRATQLNVPSIEFCGGARVKRVSVYDGMDHANDIITSYEYNDNNGISSGNISGLPNYISIQYIKSVVALPGLPPRVSGFFKYLVRSSSPSNVLNRRGGNIVNYKYVTEKHGSNSEYGKVVCEYTNGIEFPEEAAGNYPYAGTMDYDELYGHELAKMYYNKDNVKVKEVLSSYDIEYSDANNNFGQTVALKLGLLKDDIYMDASGCPLSESFSFWRFQPDMYILKTFRYTLTRTEEKLYTSTGSLGTVKIAEMEYYGDIYGQLKLVRNSRPKGGWNVCKYHYVNNVLGNNNGPASITVQSLRYSLEEWNLTSFPIVTTGSIIDDSNTEYIISSTYNELAKNGNERVYQKACYKLDLSNPILNATYQTMIPRLLNNFGVWELAYDDDYRRELYIDGVRTTGVIESVVKELDQISSYQWNDKSSKLHAIFNTATHVSAAVGNEASYENFEEGASVDFWSQGSYSITNIESHTGKFSATIPSLAPFGPTKDFRPVDQNQKYLLTAYILMPTGYNPSNCKLIAYTKQDSDNNQQEYPQTQGSFVTASPQTYSQNWVPLSVVLDLGGVKERTNINSTLRIRCYLKNDDQLSLFVDDIVFTPILADYQTFTYTDLPGNKPSSSCDSKLGYRYYYYDEFGRLEYITDYQGNVLEATRIELRRNQQQLVYNSLNKLKPKIPLSVNDILAGNFNSLDVLSSYHFIDGIGREFESVQSQLSPEGNDLVSIIKHDANNLIVRKYLPITTSNAATSDEPYLYTQTEIENYYLNPPNSVASTSRPYAECDFEDSPLKRQEKATKVGNGYELNSNHVLINSFRGNGANEVQNWSIQVNGGSKEIIMDGFYSQNTLIINETKDEDDNLRVEIKEGDKTILIYNELSVIDDNGRLITLDYTHGSSTNQGYNPVKINATTAYIYDEFGRLNYIFTPAVFEYLERNPSINKILETDNIFLDQVYAFRYDKKGRLIMEKVPGEDWKIIVYNNRNQIAFTRTSEQKSKGLVEFYKYDKSGRLILQGLANELAVNDQNVIQVNFDQYPTHWEYWKGMGSNGLFGYSNRVHPTNPVQIRVINYYDDYCYLETLANSCPVTKPSFALSYPMGSCTGQLIGIEGNSINVIDHDRYENIYYYDDKRNLVGDYKRNNVGGWNIKDLDYNFSGQLLTSDVVHSRSMGDPIQVKTTMEYDHAARLIYIFKKIDQDPTITYVNNVYNELGQVVEKNLFFDGSIWPGSQAPDYLQKIDYRYTINGWLSSINNSKLIDDGGLTNNDDVDAFGEELYYHNMPNYTTNLSSRMFVGKWNGTIGALTWKIQHPYQGPVQQYTPTHSYIYRYDELGRMTAGYYLRDEAGFPYKLDYGSTEFDEVISFDIMGNIQTLDRWSKGDFVDQLTYTYQGTSNYLRNVEDDQSSVEVGFISDNTVGVDFEYNEDGKLVSDRNKSLTTTYGAFGYPSIVQSQGGETIEMEYNGLGQKIRIACNGSIRYHNEEFQYEDENLFSIDAEEGRIRKASSNTKNPGVNYVYDLFLKDHLGSIRAVVTNEVSEDVYLATMEDYNADDEEDYFYNISNTRRTKPPGYPIDSTFSENEKISHVNPLDGLPIGHSKVLSVESGDKVTISTEYFYNGVPFIQPNIRPIADILNQLGDIFYTNPPSLLSGMSIEQRQFWSQQTFSGNGEIASFLTATFDSVDQNLPNAPRAFLVFLFFDKYFNLDPTRSGIRQANNPDQLAMLSAEEISFNTTGYFYVYVTNESPTDVSFDNLLIKHYPGFLLQENHYYPFGLLNKALSSDEQKGFHQRYGFNGKEFENGLDWRVNDFGARMYDPVLGRWGSVDPLAHKLPSWSPYVAFADNPIMFIDEDGRYPYTFHIRAFAPPGAFKGSGFQDDNRGFSTSMSATSRIKQNFTVDPTNQIFSGGTPTSDPTIWNGMSLIATDEGGAAASFGKNSFGSATAGISANFEGSNPFFGGAAPDIEVNSAISITENLKTNQVFIALDISSKQFPATEGLIQDNAGNTIFLAGAAAYGNAGNLVNADKKQAATVDLIIGINDKGAFQNVTMGGKQYNLEEFNKLRIAKPAGPLPRKDKDKGGN